MLTEQLFDFLAASPSCYHAVQALAERLERNGYAQLREQDAWALTPGGKYFVTRNGSSLLSFRIPQSAPAGFLMAAAHTDSPTFKIKHNSEKKSGPYVQLSTEKYGGMLMGTWFDRPLSVAGRVVTAKDGKLETKLVDVDRDLAVIPSVAIHMNRTANEGFKFMANIDTLPLYGMQEASGSFRSVVAKAAGVQEDEVLGEDLSLYVRTRGTCFGAKTSLFSPRGWTTSAACSVCSRAFWPRRPPAACRSSARSTMRRSAARQSRARRRACFPTRSGASRLRWG